MEVIGRDCRKIITVHVKKQDVEIGRDTYLTVGKCLDAEIAHCAAKRTHCNFVISSYRWRKEKRFISAGIVLVNHHDTVRISDRHDGVKCGPCCRKNINTRWTTSSYRHKCIDGGGRSRKGKGLNIDLGAGHYFIKRIIPLKNQSASAGASA